MLHCKFQANAQGKYEMGGKREKWKGKIRRRRGKEARRRNKGVSQEVASVLEEPEHRKWILARTKHYVHRW